MGSRLEANSNAVRKRIENHTFENEEGEEYKGSKFGGFPEYFRRKKIKLQNLDAELRAHSRDNPQIFRGVVAHVNGFTQPSLNDLHRMIVAYGGGFMQYLDGKTTVTHIIASSLTPKKIVEFRKYRIVKPAWIVDSVAAGRLLPWDQYGVVDEGKAQKILHFDNGQVTSRVNDKVRGYRDQTDSSWYTTQLAKPEDHTEAQLPTPERSSPPKCDDEMTGLNDTSEHEAVEPENSPADEFPFDEDVDELLLAEGDNSGIAATSGDKPISPGGAGGPAVNLVEDDKSTSDQGVALQGSKRKVDLEVPPASPDPKRSKLSAEEHNALLLADPRIRKSSTLNPDFLEQYYRESRLHHLSAWKADLKSQLQALTAEKSASQQTPRKRPPGARRYILHVDFDSFFVAVSLKNYPQYINHPTCVAHGGGSGSEIASCNYPAREFGVKNGMWMKRAQELCKDLTVLPYDFPAYEAASRKFYDAIMATGGIVQSVSIDEALVDVTALCLPAGGTDGVGVREGSIWREQEKANEIAQHLRDKVKSETGCSVSVGIGANILLAKVALRKAKPAGQYQIKPEEALDFLSNLEVQDLPGVAHSIGGKLEEIGIKFVKDIRDISKERLTNLLGPKTGEKIHNYARGIDRTEVGDQVVRKSVSAEVNWGVRFETQEQAEEFIESLCGELNRRLVKERVKGRQLTMKIMRRAADAPLDPPKHLGHGKCDTFNKSIVLGVATNTSEILAKEALSILRGFGFSPGELRGLGVQMTRLEPIKTSAEGDTASSQRRLQFTTAAAAAAAAPPPQLPDKPLEEPSNGEVRKSENSNSQGHVQFKTAPVQPDPFEDSVNDPIDGDMEDVQPRSVAPAPPPGIGASADSPNRKPLNVLGTQFILPSQVHFSVLAELPADIRSKLAKHVKQTDASKAQTAMPNIQNPQKLVASTALPAESQLDLDMLQALPEDVREEILAHYATSPSGKSRIAAQTLLPQSPRKVRTVAPPRRGTSARGRPRGGSLLTRLKGAARFANQSSTLTQSNFVATTRATTGHDHTATDSEGGDGDTDIAPDFLAALPEDIRKEVIAQKRAEQLRRNGGLQISAARRRAQAAAAQKQKGVGGQQQRLVGGERVWTLGAWPQKPKFTTRKLSEAGDLRKAIEEWVDVFKDEGPYEEDVVALARYLADVVGLERDMRKAVGVVEWLDWVVSGLDRGNVGKDVKEASQSVDSGGSRAAKGKAQWLAALETVKGSVKEAVKARGLGEVHFDSFA